MTVGVKSTQSIPLGKNEETSRPNGWLRRLCVCGPPQPPSRFVINNSSGEDVWVQVAQSSFLTAFGDPRRVSPGEMLASREFKYKAILVKIGTRTYPPLIPYKIDTPPGNTTWIHLG